MSVKKPLTRGKNASGNTKTHSTRKIIYPTAALEQLLADIFDDLREDHDPLRHAERRRDFVFHMTDWLNDFKDLAALYDQPEKADLKKARTFLIGFLIHVIPHLNAAGRLLLDKISDPFTEPEPKS